MAEEASQCLAYPPNPNTNTLQVQEQEALQVKEAM